MNYESLSSEITFSLKSDVLGICRLLSFKVRPIASRNATEYECSISFPVTSLVPTNRFLFAAHGPTGAFELPAGKTFQKQITVNL